MNYIEHINATNAALISLRKKTRSEEMKQLAQEGLDALNAACEQLRPLVKEHHTLQQKLKTLQEADAIREQQFCELRREKEKQLKTTVAELAEERKADKRRVRTLIILDKNRNEHAAYFDMTKKQFVAADERLKHIVGMPPANVKARLKAAGTHYYWQ